MRIVPPPPKKKRENGIKVTTQGKIKDIKLVLKICIMSN